MEDKLKRNSGREGGRKTISKTGEKMVTKTFTLAPDDLVFLEKMGHDSLSEAVRKLIAEARSRSF